MAKLAIVIQDGLVQAVVTDDPEAVKTVIDTVLVIDYDAEGADEDEISLVPRENGRFAEACIHAEDVEQAAFDFGDIKGPQAVADHD